MSIWAAFLNFGQILFGSSRVFGGISGNKVIEFTTQSAEYTWERYNVVTTYKWGRCEIGEKRTYYVSESQETNHTVHRPMASNSGTVFNFADRYDVDEDSGIITFKSVSRVVYSSSVQNTIDKLRGAGFVRGYYTRTTHTSGSDIRITGTNLETPYDGSYFYQVTSLDDSSSYCSWEYNTCRIKYNTSDAQGSYIDQVTSTSSSAYPNNGIHGDYWYVSEGSDQSRGTYIDDVASENYNAYPDNGISGSYWYIRR